MGHIPLLDELALIAALAVAVTLVLSRLKLPTVAGFLLTGAIVGPYGGKLVSSIHSIEVLAEVGVVLLLFTIGLEFSLSRLRHIFRDVAVGGILQVGLTVLAAVIVSRAMQLPISTGLFFGFVFALSSTAIVLRALGERKELDAPHGRFIVGTLIVQDLLVVPMVLVVPLLGGPGHPAGAALEISKALLKAILVVVSTVVVARLVVPRVLAWVDAARSREVFLLAILGLCIGTAWLTSMANLSLALGAFLGGMVVADTEYGHRAMGDILPLRDAFLSVFFISLGMLFDVGAVLAHPLLVSSLLFAFVFGKGVLSIVAALVMRFPARASWLAGIGLAQFGELGFVLVRLGETSGMVNADTTHPLLAAGIASMFLTPLLIRLAPRVTAGERLLAALERRIGVGSIDEASEKEPLSGHAVIVGYGLAGRATASALDAIGARYIVLEMNAETVRAARGLSRPVYYGDATSEETLGHAHLAEAKLLVILMNDPAAAERVVATARRVARDVPVLMRTHYLEDRGHIASIGADEIVAEEVEGAAEMMGRVLRRFAADDGTVAREVGEFRKGTRRAAT